MAETTDQSQMKKDCNSKSATCRKPWPGFATGLPTVVYFSSGSRDIYPDFKISREHSLESKLELLPNNQDTLKLPPFGIPFKFKANKGSCSNWTCIISHSAFYVEKISMLNIASQRCFKLKINPNGMKEFNLDKLVADFKPNKVYFSNSTDPNDLLKNPFILSGCFTNEQNDIVIHLSEDQNPDTPTFDKSL